MTPAPYRPTRLVIPHPGLTITCACGWCGKCRARARKAEQHNVRVDPDWRVWPEIYKYLFFRSIARDLLGPDANLRSSLG